MKPKRIVIWFTFGIALFLSLCTWFTQPSKVDRTDRVQMVWMTVHLPAFLMYAGTLAEHDPFKGWGFLFFVFAQWSVVGFLVGVTVRDMLLERQLRERFPSGPPL